MRVPVSRLERALTLDCEPMGDGRMLVSGGAAPHVAEPATGDCDCEDYLRRRAPCKHVLRVRLAQGDAGLLRSVGGLVASLRRGGQGPAHRGIAP